MCMTSTCVQVRDVHRSCARTPKHILRERGRGGGEHRQTDRQTDRDRDRQIERGEGGRREANTQHASAYGFKSCSDLDKHLC